jgi:hypothetical protein
MSGCHFKKWRKRRLFGGWKMSGYSAVGSHTTEPVLERLLMMKQETFVFKIPPGLTLEAIFFCFERPNYGLFNFEHAFKFLNWWIRCKFDIRQQLQQYLNCAIPFKSVRNHFMLWVWLNIFHLPPSELVYLQGITWNKPLSTKNYQNK